MSGHWHSERQALRLAQRNASAYSIISISSSSPDDEPSNHPASPRHADQTPSGGILPVDESQHLIINSVEVPTVERGVLRGHEHYLQQATVLGKRYRNISTDFEAYRNKPPPSTPAAPPRAPTPPPQTIDLGPRGEQINYNMLPDAARPYRRWVYIGTTYNPLIALAILHVTQKNLPFLDFTSPMEHLPNVSPTMAAPRFPPLRDGKLPWLDGATEWRRAVSDQKITVMFLPFFYADGRHAMCFYTLRARSGRLCHIAVSPCTLNELHRAGLVRSKKRIDGVSKRHEDLEDLELGVGRGEWVGKGEKRDEAINVVGKEWVLRVKLTTREIDVESQEARRVDGGMSRVDVWD